MCQAVFRAVCWSRAVRNARRQALRAGELDGELELVVDTDAEVVGCPAPVSTFGGLYY